MVPLLEMKTFLSCHFSKLKLQQKLLGGGGLHPPPPQCLPLNFLYLPNSQLGPIHMIPAEFEQGSILVHLGFAFKGIQHGKCETAI